MDPDDVTLLEVTNDCCIAGERKGATIRKADTDGSLAPSRAPLLEDHRGLPLNVMRQTNAFQRLQPIRLSRCIRRGSRPLDRCREVELRPVEFDPPCILLVGRQTLSQSALRCRLHFRLPW